VPAPPKSTHGVLVVTSDLFGYLGPCGCSENMRGGIARTAWQLDQIRGEGAPVRFIDAGNTLFSPVPLQDAEVPQAEAKARALAQALTAMKLDAHAAGPLDLARGPDFVRALSLPQIPADSPRYLELGGHTLALVAGSSADTIATLAQRARTQGAELVIALFHGPLADAQAAAAQALGADLLVASHGEDIFAGEESRLIRSATPLVDIQSKGRSILRLDVSFGGQGAFVLATSGEEQTHQADKIGEQIELLKKQADYPGASPERVKLINAKVAELSQRRNALLNSRPEVPAGQNALSARFVPIEPAFPESLQIKAIADAYDREVARINLAYAQAHAPKCPAPEPGKASYVGSAACRDCHPEAYDVWTHTKHFHAYETLVGKSKQFNLECIGCHVTGINQPGGVCRVDQVEGRKGVGCEVCHGPGSIHADDPSDENIRREVPKTFCVLCHNPENSPHFDFALYLPQILGKGHSRR
jgi:hypothetical protein